MSTTIRNLILTLVLHFKFFQLLQAKRECKRELLKCSSAKSAYKYRTYTEGELAYLSYIDSWLLEVSKYNFLIKQCLSDYAKTIFVIALYFVLLFGTCLAIAARLSIPF